VARVLVVSGPGTGVGKTAVTAAIAALANARGDRVADVAAAGLGTLNHTALTLEALAARKLTPAGVVIGSWPRRPGLAELANLTDLQAVAGGPLAGVMPEGAGGLDRAGFLAAAAAGLAGHLGVSSAS
jgi:dethiobiotin synthetase